MLLTDFLADVSERKAELGPIDGTVSVEVCRNKGERRTARKRVILDRAAARAQVAGKAFQTSYR